MRQEDPALVQIRTPDGSPCEVRGAASGEGPAGSQPNDATRRRFLGIAGASLALATAAGCGRMGDTGAFLPYSTPPEQATPGVPEYYATAALAYGVAQGVIVESHLGRPTKVEGNPAHPASLGATDVLSQACLLDLYDPDRSRHVVEHGRRSSWSAFASFLQQALAPIRAAGGKGFALLTETVISPSLGSQISKVMAALPGAQWHQYDPAGPHAARAGALAAFGRHVHTYYRLDRADVIVSLDADFLASGPGSTRYAHDYAFGRRVRGSNTAMNRLYVAESLFTATGGKAEHRFRLKYPEVGRFAAELAAAVGALGQGTAGGARYAGWTGPVARDLLAHRGRSAVLAGETQPAEVHALCHAINAALGNVGQTVIYTDPLEVRPEDQVASLWQLVQDMREGRIRVLLILGGNPVYNAPADMNFAGALAATPLSAHLALHFDETSRLARWHLPESHFLETWGDARAFDGTVTILQPLIERLYDSRSQLEVLDLLLQDPNRSSQEIVRSYWKANAKAQDFEKWWRISVGRGLIADSALPEIRPAPGKVDAAPLLQEKKAQGLDLIFRTDPFIYDGRYANNAWLQELPRDITKLTWDNAVYVSPQTAERLKLKNQHCVDLKYRGRSVRGSVWIAPGQADDTVAVYLGYGRNVGVVADGAGFNAYLIRTSDALWYGAGLEVQPAGATYPLATTQMQKSLAGREDDILISKPVETYRKDPDFVRKIHPEPGFDETLYPHWTYTGYNWGMVIDLTACVNCSACVIACQAENNILPVGKLQGLFHREMHWLRVDAYYRGDWNNPSAAYQPVPCMHCENAPCELVCPVQATVHSADGLNDMVYNRCVGTRFCSNNCPYKVRRFNFLEYADWQTKQVMLQRNPDVTVRIRGVMEKCTYCVQRIREAEIRARDQGRYVRDGELQTACQQVCPTQAIVFGDMNNPSNRVARLKREKLNYGMLSELNTRPHTTYLAELRNPNPELRENV